MEYLSRTYVCHECGESIVDEKSAWTFSLDDGTRVPLCGSCGEKLAARREHERHVENREWHEDCDDCVEDAKAIDWLLAVRKYGLEAANRMFP